MEGVESMTYRCLAAWQRDATTPQEQSNFPLKGKCFEQPSLRTHYKILLTIYFGSALTTNYAVLLFLGGMRSRSSSPMSDSVCSFLTLVNACFFSFMSKLTK